MAESLRRRLQLIVFFNTNPIHLIYICSAVTFSFLYGKFLAFGIRVGRNQDDKTKKSAFAVSLGRCTFR